MDNDNRYLDRLLENNIIESASSSCAEIILEGGGNENTSKDFPSGGFPPILKCNKCDNVLSNINNVEKKQRHFQSDKKAVNIKDILDKKKDIKPFFSLD